MTKPDIEAIRQSPRQYVDLETVEWLSDYAMILEQQLSKLTMERDEAVSAVQHLTKKEK
jgi:hypothetical protein